MNFDPWYAQQGEMPGPDGKPIRRLTAEEMRAASKKLYPTRDALLAHYVSIGLLNPDGTAARGVEIDQREAA